MQGALPFNRARLAEKIKPMSFKLNRRLKSNNRYLQKKLFSYAKPPIDFGFKKDKVTFFAYYPSEGNVSGHYKYNRKGHVTEYVLMGSSVDNVSLHTFVFPLKRGAKSFQRHVNHLSYAMANDPNYNLYLQEGLSTGNCQRMAGYLGQLQGAEPDETGVKLATTGWCISYS